MDSEREYDEHAARLNKITDRDIEDNEIRRAMERRERHLSIEEQKLFRDAFRSSAKIVRQVLPLRKDVP